MTKEKQRTQDEINLDYKKSPIGIQAFPNAKSKVDTAGYMSLERRVKSLQHAGQILHAARSAQFDGTSENFVAPPMRGYGQDLADLSEMARTHQTKMDALKIKHQQRKKRQAEAQKPAPEEADKKADADKKTESKTQKNKPSAE